MRKKKIQSNKLKKNFINHKKKIKTSDYLSDKYYIVSTSACFLTKKQIESCIKIIGYYVRRARRYFDSELQCIIPVTKKPRFSRMGSGKGRIRKFIAKINVNTLLFMFDKEKIDYTRMWTIFKAIEHRLPMKVRLAETNNDHILNFSTCTNIWYKLNKIDNFNKKKYSIYSYIKNKKKYTIFYYKNLLKKYFNILLIILNNSERINIKDWHVNTTKKSYDFIKSPFKYFINYRKNLFSRVCDFNKKLMDYIILDNIIWIGLEQNVIAWFYIIDKGYKNLNYNNKIYKLYLIYFINNDTFITFKNNKYSFIIDCHIFFSKSHSRLIRSKIVDYLWEKHSLSIGLEYKILNSINNIKKNNNIRADRHNLYFDKKNKVITILNKQKRTYMKNTFKKIH